ncbi:hypothetical protein TNCV_2615091 [Trichonephila clavipes]|nr:hypothetical protein TNCV_2615091 [Trichonephila clavipes]
MWSEPSYKALTLVLFGSLDTDVSAVNKSGKFTERKDWAPCFRQTFCNWRSLLKGGDPSQSASVPRCWCSRHSFYGGQCPATRLLKFSSFSNNIRMDWTVLSPDLNSIEHVWDALGRCLVTRLHPPWNTQQQKQIRFRTRHSFLKNDWAV